jgi:hypothetical protein
MQSNFRRPSLGSANKLKRGVRERIGLSLLQQLTAASDQNDNLRPFLRRNSSHSKRPLTGYCLLGKVARAKRKNAQRRFDGDFNFARQLVKYNAKYPGSALVTTEENGELAVLRLGSALTSVSSSSSLSSPPSVKCPLRERSDIYDKEISSFAESDNVAVVNAIVRIDRLLKGLELARHQSVENLYGIESRPSRRGMPRIFVPMTEIREDVGGVVEEESGTICSNGGSKTTNERHM